MVLLMHLQCAELYPLNTAHPPCSTCTGTPAKLSTPLCRALYQNTEGLAPEELLV